MFKQFRVVLIICLILQILSQNSMDQYNCPKDMRINSIGEEVMNNDNYIKIVQQRKYFVLYITASWCDFCCQTEMQLLELRTLLHNRKFNGHDISIISINSDKHSDAIKEYKLSLFKIPTIYFVKDKQFYQYGGFVASQNILQFINKILHPVVELYSVQDVDSFMDTTKNFPERNDFLGSTELNINSFTDFQYKNRIVGFFSDADDYSAEYSSFLSIAEKIAYRYDLRIGIVLHRDIVFDLKRMYDGIWFNSHSWNSVVIKRNTKYYFLDLSLLSEHLENFMVYNTMCAIDELSINNNNILTKIQTPIVFLFTDASFNLVQFHMTLKSFIDLAEIYAGNYVFIYVDGNTKTKSKEVFGLQKETEIPTIVINYLGSNKQKHFPEDTPLDYDNVKSFLDENISVGGPSSDLDQLKTKQMKSYDDKIVRLLKFSTKLEKSKFKPIINNKKYDVIVFIVDTDYDYFSEKVAKYYNRVIERFKALGINSLLFTSYDINEHGPLTGEGFTAEKGQIYMFPARTKKVKEFKVNLTVLRLMKWIESESEIKIRLPEIPHIDLELHEEYYKKKTVLETYDENLNKNYLEIDDMIGMDFSKLELEETKKIEL